MLKKLMRWRSALRQSFTLKDNANERNESWLSNCRVQLIFCKNDTRITFFKKLLGVTTWNIVGTLYWWYAIDYSWLICIQMNYSKGKIIICVCLCLVAILFAPYLLTRPLCDELSFVDTGQIGDTIGGTTAPIVGIVSIVLLAYTLIEQLKFNAKQVDLQRQEQFKATFFELLKEQRDIANYLCNQLDDASCIADCLEEMCKHIRQHHNEGL